MDLTCFKVNCTYDAGSNCVTLTQRALISDGFSYEETNLLCQDADNNAVYDVDNDILQIDVLDTDYVSYVVVAGCVEDDTSLDYPGIVSIAREKPTS